MKKENKRILVAFIVSAIAYVVAFYIAFIWRG